MTAAHLAPSKEDVAAITPARVAALVALGEVARGAPADDALATAASSIQASPADRALAHELVYGVLRGRRRLDAILSRYARTGLPTDAVLDAMRVGAYSLLWLDRVPAHAAVSTAVEAVKRFGAEFAAKFVNASLRSVARDGAAIRAETPPGASAKTPEIAEWYSFPNWMVDAMRPAAPGGDIHTLLTSLNEAAPLCLRVRSDRDAMLVRLRDAGLVAEPGKYAPECIVMPSMRGPIPALPGWDEGAFSVQDEAAQMITELVDPRPGETLLDVCAAPGGKAIHAAHRGARVTGIDSDPHRLHRIREAATRLGVTLELFAEEVGDRPIEALKDATFSKVLVDAPCSGTGIVRRKPDVKWARRAEDIPRMAERQFAILAGAARHVAPDGLLVYAVCSLAKAEGEAVIEKFLAASAGAFRIEDVRRLPRASALEAFRTVDGTFRAWPSIHGTDGFFAAALRRN